MTTECMTAADTQNEDHSGQHSGGKLEVVGE